VVGINWWVAAVAALQFVAAGWAAWGTDWKMAVINGSVAVANGVLATMAKA
jgi:hypothetical protein